MTKYVNIRLTRNQALALKQYIDSPSIDDLPNKTWVNILNSIQK